MTITLTREEAQQVLDALRGDSMYAARQARETLRARLAQPEPEPAKLLLIPALMEQAGWVRKREWQGLTDEERSYLAWESNNGPHCVAMTEAKLKEKNT